MTARADSTGIGRSLIAASVTRSEREETHDRTGNEDEAPEHHVVEVGLPYLDVEPLFRLGLMCRDSRDDLFQLRVSCDEHGRYQKSLWCLKYVQFLKCRHDSS